MFEKLLSFVSVSAFATISCFGTVLLSEGVPTAAVSGADGYAAGDALRDKNATTWETGFSSSRTWLGGTGVIYIHDAAGGLAFPAVFSAGSSITNMGTSVGFNTTGTDAVGRGLYRQFASGFAWPASGSVYVRLLMKMESGASANLAAGGYWGMGLVQSTFSGTDSGLKGLTTDGFWFAFKNDAGTRRLVLRVRGTDYTLLDSVVDGVTYVCLAKIDIGSAGADAISGYAVASGDYSKAFNYQVKAVSADLVSGTSPLAYLALAGQYMTGGTRVKFDEVAAATEASDVIVVDDSAPDWGSASITKSGDDFTLAASLSHGEGFASYILDDGATVITNALGAATTNAAVTATIATLSLTADKTYSVTVLATNDQGSVATKAAGTFYTGSLTLLKTADANELGCVPGTVTVSRVSAETVALAVAYSFAGSGSNPAIEGTDYVAPSGTVTIPAGAASAVILITPKVDVANASDTTLDVSLDAGNYTVGSAVTVMIKTFTTPDGYDYWAASADSDGLASTAANWSNGSLPKSTDIVVVDGDYSKVPMIWDAPSNGLTDTVAGWTQSADYTGTNTFNTTYASYDTAFTNFTVTGDVDIENGSWTHPTNGAVQAYRLAVTVGGGFTLAAAATVDLYQKGFAAGKRPATGVLGVHAGGYGSVTNVYGDVCRPMDLGAGGSQKAGGGALWLQVSGAAVVDGTVRANSFENSSAWNTPYAGAGGSVSIVAASLSGSGAINVSAPQCSQGSPGSGGRIGIVLTSANALAMPVSNLRAQGSTGTGVNSTGAGTVFVKTADQAHGTLYVRNVARSVTYGYTYPSRCGTTLIPPGQTWTFDSIVLSDYGILGIPTNTTLVLPNGFASISGNGKTCGILCLGGTITAADSASAVLQSNWVFQADSPYVFPGDVAIKDGAAIGCLCLLSKTNDYARCDVSVAGGLSIDTNGWVFAGCSGIAHDNSDASWFNGAFSSGGQIGGYGQHAAAYGSVLHPALPGTVGWISDSADQNLGGGVVKLTVAGALVLDGKAVSDGTGGNSYNGTGTGGSLNFVVGSLSGSGSIAANGGKPTRTDWTSAISNQNAKARNLVAGSAGGRVSVRLTDSGATFSDYWEANITAKGVSNSNAAYTNAMSSAGTVYLQDGTQAEGAGMVIVRNDSNALNTKAMTPIPSTTWGGENDDLSRASLVLDGDAIVLVTTNVTFAAATVASGSKIDLAGHSVTVSTLTLANQDVAMGTYAAAAAAVSGYVQDSVGGGSIIVKGKVGGFVIRICDSDVAVPGLWITNHLAAADRASDAAISNALVSAGANGLDRWQSYALGLDPDKMDSVVLCDARQDASSARATLFARNVAPATNDAFSVSYVLEGSNDGASWIEPVLVSQANAFAVSLPGAYLFYRIRADIVLK